MDKVLETILNNYEMLDAVRRRKGTDFTVEVLRENLEISRTTADKMLNVLKSENLIEKQDRRIVINGKAALFLGISIGTKHTRVELLDLDFKAVPRETIRTYPRLKALEDLRILPQFKESESDEECLAYMTSFDYEDEPGLERKAGRDFHSKQNQFRKLQALISSIVQPFLQQARDSKENPDTPSFPLMGIGLAVTGPVDYAEKLWRSAPRQFTEVQNISLMELVGYDCYQQAEEMGIFFAFDNNAKTAMISEYQYLLEMNSSKPFDEDIALLYIGSGIGSAAVLGGTLLRGSHNLSGELGYLRVQMPSDREGGVIQTIDECLERLDEEKDFEKYSACLAYTLNTINCVLGIDQVVLVGHSIRKNKRLIPFLMEQRMQFTVMSTQHYCKPMVGQEKAGTSAIGAAIESYMSMCHYNESRPKDRINLAKEISWK